MLLQRSRCRLPGLCVSLRAAPGTLRLPPPTSCTALCTPQMRAPAKFQNISGGSKIVEITVVNLVECQGLTVSARVPPDSTPARSPPASRSCPIGAHRRDRKQAELCSLDWPLVRKTQPFSGLACFPRRRGPLPAYLSLHHLHHSVLRRSVRSLSPPCAQPPGQTPGLPPPCFPAPWLIRQRSQDAPTSGHLHALSPLPVKMPPLPCSGGTLQNHFPKRPSQSEKPLRPRQLSHAPVLTCSIFLAAVGLFDRLLLIYGTLQES